MIPTESPNYVVAHALSTFDMEPDKYSGVLLCEGAPGGIDESLYQRVYPNLLAIPMGGCSHILDSIDGIRKRLYDYPVVGFLDRDNRSKAERRALVSEGIYTTGLPYIEHVIATPEIIKLIAYRRGYDPDEILKKVQKNLFNRAYATINDDFTITWSESMENLKSIRITFMGEGNRNVETIITPEDVFFSLKKKAVACEHAFAMGLKGTKAYYGYFIELLDDPEIGAKLFEHVKKHLPDIDLDRVPRI